MELEVSYNENYCLEGRAERQRGATDRDDGRGQAVGMACVDRHTLFITPLSSPRDAFAPTMSPAPPSATSN